MVNGDVSLSIAEAFEQQLTDDSVAAACVGRIKEHKENTHRRIREIISKLVTAGYLKKSAQK